jgi:electron transfer flavoprotein alpha subunit
VANIVVFAEVRHGEVTLPSRYAVAEARRVASLLGATVYAVLTLGRVAEEAIEGHARALGMAGADRILCCADGALDGPLLDGDVGPFLAALAQRLRPALTVFPAGGVGLALGPPLALRTAGVFHPRACLEVLRDEAGVHLSVRRFRASDGGARVLEVAAARSRPVVITLPAGADPGSHGAPAVEVEMLAYVPPAAGARRIRELSSDPDPAEAVELAPALLSLGADVKPADEAALRANVPAGTVVVREGERPAGLDTACPSRLLVAGKAPAPALVRRAVAPGTRVAVAGGKSAEKDLGRIDVIWRPAKEGLSLLVAALGGEPGKAKVAR